MHELWVGEGRVGSDNGGKIESEIKSSVFCSTGISQLTRYSNVHMRKQQLRGKQFEKAYLGSILKVVYCTSLQNPQKLSHSRLPHRRSSHGGLSYERLSHKRLSYEIISHRTLSHGNLSYSKLPYSKVILL